VASGGQGRLADEVVGAEAGRNSLSAPASWGLDGSREANLMRWARVLDLGVGVRQSAVAMAAEYLAPPGAGELGATSLISGSSIFGRWPVFRASGN
jgi:hypothetical protein